MFSLVVAIASFCALAQASNLVARQTPAGTPTAQPTAVTSAPACCFLYVNAFGYLTTASTTSTVTITVRTEVVADASRTITRTVTISNGVTIPSTPDTFTGTDVSVSVISSAIVTEVPTATPTGPDVGNTGISPGTALVQNGLIFSAPPVRGQNGEVLCETPVSTVRTTYVAPTTFVVTATSMENPFVNYASGWVQYNAAIVSGQPVVFPEIASFQFKNDPSETTLPQQIINYLQRVPSIVAQFPQISSCTAKIGTAGTTSTVTPIVTETTSQTVTFNPQAQAQTTDAPFRNSTRTTSSLNTPLNPSSRAPLTSTVWVGPGANVTAPIYTGGAATSQLNWVPISILEGFISIIMYLIY